VYILRQSHSDNGHVHATALYYVVHMHSLRLAPQCHAFI